MDFRESKEFVLLISLEESSIHKFDDCHVLIPLNLGNLVVSVHHPTVEDDSLNFYNNLADVFFDYLLLELLLFLWSNHACVAL